MAVLVTPAPPCVLFEDEHLLVVNKPAGLNTHAPAPHAGEGIYEWLRDREPRWASLAIIHRLDKDTSGVLLLARTPAANRSLTAQFAQRRARKRYLLLTDRAVPDGVFTVRTAISRVGDRYVSRSVGAGGDVAETRFRRIGPSGEHTLVEAFPLTGRTHQIRIHAAERGFPVLGDPLYGGSTTGRLCLHAAELSLEHPGSGRSVTFEAPVDFAADPRLALRMGLIDSGETDALRLIHGASDGWPGWYVDRLGDYLLSQSEYPLGMDQKAVLKRFMDRLALRGAYHKRLAREARSRTPAEAIAQPVLGEVAPERFTVRENGVQFELSFQEGYSVGLFLDQRDNRRRLLTGHVGAGFPLAQSAIPSPQPQVLNVFAYTCGFSVCAARAGFHTASLDLSKKYLEWGGRSFALDGIDPAGHDFIYGEAFDWMRRLAKKGRAFDTIVLDPPTFSQSKEHGVFRAEQDYGRLVGAALPLLKPDGVLLASTNAAGLKPERFLAQVKEAVASAGRRVTQERYAPQPPDFPISREEPAYLKTVWLRIA